MTAGSVSTPLVWCEVAESIALDLGIDVCNLLVAIALGAKWPRAVFDAQVFLDKILELSP